MRDQRFTCWTDLPRRWPPRLGLARPPPQPADARGALREDHRLGGRKVGGKSIGRRRHTATESHSPVDLKDKTSTHRGRPPRLLRMTPIDTGQKVAKLCRRDRHHAVGCARPQKAAPLQPLREQAGALAVVPDHLQQIASPPSEAEQVTAQRIALAAPPAPAAPATGSPSSCRCGPSPATPAHLAGTGSCAPQRGDDARDQSSVRGAFDTHPVTALELDLNGCRASRDFPSPCRSHLLSCIRRRLFLGHVDGCECQRRNSVRLRSIVADKPFGQRLAAPREQLARVDAALPCNLRHRVARTACLFDKLELLLLAPPPSALRPRDDLNPPAHRPCA